MNYKKGFIRLFIVSTVISMIGGFFYTAPDSQKSTSFDIETIWSIEKNLKEPACREIVSRKPEKFPEMNPGYACSPLSIYWERIRAFQKENIGKYPVFDENLVHDAMWDGIREQQKRTAIFGVILGLILNTFIWVCGLLIFYTARWIRRGFGI